MMRLMTKSLIERCEFFIEGFAANFGWTFSEEQYLLNYETLLTKGNKAISARGCNREDAILKLIARIISEAPRWYNE